MFMSHPVLMKVSRKKKGILTVGATKDSLV